MTIQVACEALLLAAYVLCGVCVTPVRYLTFEELAEALVTLSQPQAQLSKPNVDTRFAHSQGNMLRYALTMHAVSQHWPCSHSTRMP